MSDISIILSEISSLQERVENYHRLKQQVISRGYSTNLEQESYYEQMREIDNQIHGAEMRLITLRGEVNRAEILGGL